MGSEEQFALGNHLYADFHKKYEDQKRGNARTPDIEETTNGCTQVSFSCGQHMCEGALLNSLIKHGKTEDQILQ